MIKHLLFLIGLVFSFSTSYEQCCSAGNPMGGDGNNEGQEFKSLMLYASFRHSYSSDYFNGSKKVAVPLIEDSFYNFSGFSLTYGLTPRLSLHGEFGYFFDKQQDLTINDAPFALRAEGFGDALFAARYLAIADFSSHFNLLLSSGIRLPIGAFHEQLDGITIPVSIQPSSGAYKLQAGIYASQRKPGSKFGWSAYFHYEWSRKIEEGFLVYKYGAYTQLAMAVMYEFHPGYSFLLRPKFEFRGKDRRENDLLINATGSKVLLLNAQINIRVMPKTILMIQGEVPLYKNVNAYQLTNKYSWQLGLSQTLSFI